MKNQTLLPFAMRLYCHTCARFLILLLIHTLGVALPPPTASHMCWNPCYKAGGEPLHPRNTPVTP